MASSPPRTWLGRRTPAAAPRPDHTDRAAPAGVTDPLSDLGRVARTGLAGPVDCALGDGCAGRTGSAGGPDGSPDRPSTGAGGGTEAPARADPVDIVDGVGASAPGAVAPSGRPSALDAPGVGARNGTVTRLAACPLGRVARLGPPGFTP